MEVVYSNKSAPIICNNGIYYKVLSYGNKTKFIKIDKLNSLIKETGCKILAMQELHKNSYMVYLSNGKLYSVGESDNGQLGYSYGIIDKFRVISNAYKITQIACSEIHTLILTLGGDVYGCGNNKRGQLGLGWNSEATYNNLQPLKWKASRILCRGYSSALMKGTDLYMFGCNGYSNLGLTDNNYENPTFVMSNVQEVSMGHTYTLILKNNKVLISGEDSYSTKWSNFTEIIRGSNITNVIAAKYAILIVMNNEIKLIDTEYKLITIIDCNNTYKYLITNNEILDINTTQLTTYYYNSIIPGTYVEDKLLDVQLDIGRMSYNSIIKRHYLVLLWIINKPTKYKLRLPRLVIMNILNQILNS